MDPSVRRETGREIMNNDVKTSLHDAISKQLHHSEFDVVGIVPIPAHSDKMVRLRTLQEMLEDFDQVHESGTIEYLLQLKPKKAQQAAVPAQESTLTPAPAAENIYLSNGKMNVPFLLKNGDLLYDAGDYALARNIYKSILSSGEYTSTILNRLGRCFEADGKLEEARKSYEESIAYLPNLDSYQRLSASLVRQNKDQQAAELLERALNLRDLTTTQRFELLKSSGNCWTRIKRSEQAELCFNRALELDPSADDVRSNLGVLYLQGNKITEAKRNFQDAIASNPRNHQALAGLGSCSLAEGDKKAAHDYFAQSLDIELNNPTAIFYLVKCAYELKSYSGGARILSNYIEIAPVNTNLLYSLAGLQFHLGKIQEAKSTTLKILELQQDHTGAKDLLNLIQRYAGAAV